MPKRQHESNMENPSEFAAWAFAAGIPDPRGEQFGNQPLIPAPCFPALSRMLWDLGFRHHADLQTKWVPDYPGPDRNLLALGLTDTEPEKLTALAAEMLVDQFPAVAERLKNVTPENRDEFIAEQAQELMSAMGRLKAATERLRREDESL
jgi:hypothetical protein